MIDSRDLKPKTFEFDDLPLECANNGFRKLIEINIRWRLLAIRCVMENAIISNINILALTHQIPSNPTHRSLLLPSPGNYPP